MSKLPVLVTGVSAMNSCRPRPVSPFYSFNEWNWFECRFCRASQTLIGGVAQIISSFISFGSLHIRTGGFEPWQWYDQVGRLTSSQFGLTSFEAYDNYGDTYPRYGSTLLVSIPNVS